jgi:hypothetical protein
MAETLFATWHDAFLATVQEPQTAEPLKGASLAADMMAWTAHLTTAVVQSCEELGWPAAARGHRLALLPLAGQEYLSIDVMTFPKQNEESATFRWPMPLAAIELENARDDERVAYSLWKVLCVRAPLRVVFAYRPNWEQSRALVQALQESVIGGMGPAERMALGGETVVIVGNRGEGETFPWGYFKCWRLDTNLGRFEKI